VRKAAVSLVTSGGKILCVWNRTFNGWTLPGGKVEPGERIAMAQHRELLEETGLDAVASKLLYVDVNEADGAPMLVHVYLVEPDRLEKARGMEEGCPVEWIPRETLLEVSPFAKFYEAMFKELET
jgi:8-oxo-dGTP diphosphatase